MQVSEIRTDGAERAVIGTAAQRDPAAFNLVRVRMGGWTEFFITLFPDHQEQHKRRPLYA